MAHPLAGLERLVEEAVRDGAGRSHLERVLIGPTDLGQDLGLARYHRVEPAGDREQVLGGVAALVHVQQRLDLVLAAVRVRRQPPHGRLAHRPRIGADHVQLAAVAGRDADRLDHGVLRDHGLDQSLPVCLRRQLLADGDRGVAVAGADQQQPFVRAEAYPALSADLEEMLDHLKWNLWHGKVCLERWKSPMNWPIAWTWRTAAPNTASS